MHVARSTAMALATVALTVGAAQVGAEVVSYDAGIHPGTAPDPVTQGWTALDIDPEAGAIGQAVNNDDALGRNAWNITDGSSSDRPRYEQAIDATDIAAMAANGWTLSAVVKSNGGNEMVGWGVSDDTAFGGNGDARRWGFGVFINNGNLYVPWFGGSNIQVTEDGTGGDDYYLIELVAEPNSLEATLYINGIEVGTSSGQVSGNIADKIEFGGVSTGGTGSDTNWHRVTLVPEPASAMLMGGAGLFVLRRRR